MSNYTKIFQSSPRYWEDVESINLAQMTQDGLLPFILLGQPPICDDNCRRCFIHVNNYRSELRNTLSREESRRLLDQAREHGAIALEISGEGEPTLSQNLPSIIEHASKNGIHTTLISNGNSYTKDSLQFFRDHNVGILTSLSTLNPETYTTDNRHGNLQRKLDNIDLLANVFQGTDRKIGSYHVLRAGINTTLQKDNTYEIESLRQFAHERNLFFGLASLAETEHALENSSIIVGDNTENIVESYRDNSLIHSKSSVEDFGREVCGTCAYGLNIRHDGEVMLDMHFARNISLGNIRNMTYQQAIQRQQKAIRELFQSFSGYCPARDVRAQSFLDNHLLTNGYTGTT